ncbi:amidohydrolase [Chloropicon primus]|uniref:Amidohydrolase n=1 Tax=Chloropicon primus TaxID=1764295 RepID=A0A5B8MFS3_9CHLO|nr:amidohydrolase [Chloropicon primus]UPQ98729.1 amidohydrolase [Chloropicon primus]|mmetsp:Transcript_306/g.784  ORF Transcript_306/g.784 Transcript_306/m.784 type:complete len:571 (+) Transcript_306:174-1886(+)|eukprot:QDZ19518.1 amidohydrolase [Chloropicon primus]
MAGSKWVTWTTWLVACVSYLVLVFVSHRSGGGGGGGPEARDHPARFFFNFTLNTGKAVVRKGAIVSNALGDILDVGEEAGVRERLKGSVIEAVDLEGKYVFPGLVDAHAHLIMGGSFLSQLDLRDATSRADFIERVRDRAANLEPGAWLIGYGFDERKLGEMPNAGWISQATPDNPVLILRADGHRALVNFYLLAMANITSRPDPLGGKIERDAGGSPTGILTDTAIAMVRSLQPKPSKGERKDSIMKAMAYANSMGVTMVSDMGTPAFAQSADECWSDLVDVWMEIAAQDELTLRVQTCVPLDLYDSLASFVEKNGDSLGMLSWGCVKEFYDGSLGSETALMNEPYEGTTNRGLRIHEDRAVLQERLANATGRGLQAIVHAIGDLAVDEASAILSAAGSRSKNPNRLEHVQHVSGSGALDRIRDAEIYAVVNPLHIQDDARTMLEKLGSVRSGKGRSFPFKSMLDRGVKIAFGSDWPLVAPLDPLGSLLESTSGRRHVPEEAVSREQGFRAITSNAAEAAGAKGLVGRLQKGQKCDFVVLDRDLLEVEEKPVVLHTFVNGVCRYSRRDI